MAVTRCLFHGGLYRENVVAMTMTPQRESLRHRTRRDGECHCHHILAVKAAVDKHRVTAISQGIETFLDVAKGQRVRPGI